MNAQEATSTSQNTLIVPKSVKTVPDLGKGSSVRRRARDSTLRLMTLNMSSIRMGLLHHRWSFTKISSHTRAECTITKKVKSLVVMLSYWLDGARVKKE